MAEYDRREFIQRSSGAMAALVLAPGAKALRSEFSLEDPITVALVGVGMQGRAILTQLATLENVRVVALCDTYSRALRRGKRRAKEATGYGDYREMLSKEKDLQAVVIAAPSHHHKEIALACLKASKHVYCEAPLASSIADMKAIAAAAQKAPTVFCVGHVRRSNPVYKLARSFFRSGAIRDLTALRAQSHQKSAWRRPERSGIPEREVNWRLYAATSLGLLGEEGSHQFDAISWFTGRHPVSVVGSQATLLYDDGRECADTVSCLFTYEDGVRLDYDATLTNSFEGRYEVLAGSMGTFKLAERFGWLFKEADAPIQGWEVYASRESFHNEEGITLIADATKLAKQGKLKEGIGLPHPPLRYALADFFTSIAQAKPPACSALDGLAAGAVAAKAAEAVRGEKTVEIGADLFEV